MVYRFQPSEIGNMDSDDLYFWLDGLPELIKQYAPVMRM